MTKFFNPPPSFGPFWGKIEFSSKYCSDQRYCADFKEKLMSGFRATLVSDRSMQGHMDG